MQLHFLILIHCFDCDHSLIYISYLIKSWDWAVQGKTLVPTLDYLNKFVKRRSNQRWDPSIAGIIDALQAVAAKYVLPTLQLFAHIHTVDSRLI